MSAHKAFYEKLSSLSGLRIRQVFEAMEFLGFETRNKYRVETPTGEALAYAAEQQKGFFGFLARQFLGHWKRFSILVYSPEKQPLLELRHPFRWIFQRVEITDLESKRMVGAVQQRFAFFSKRFDVENALGQVLFTVKSPVWKIWTFPFERNGTRIATVGKTWGGLLSEALTDKDQFLVSFEDTRLNQVERVLIFAAGIFIDLQYFEKKAN